MTEQEPVPNVTYRLLAKLYIKIKNKKGKKAAEEWAAKKIPADWFPLVRPYLKEELNKCL